MGDIVQSILAQSLEFLTAQFAYQISLKARLSGFVVANKYVGPIRKHVFLRLVLYGYRCNVTPTLFVFTCKATPDTPQVEQTLGVHQRVRVRSIVDGCVVFLER